MYKNSTPPSPISKGVPYGETIEWKTPRLSSNSSSARRISDGLLVTRNLMLDQSFSEPSSPKPKHSPGGSPHHSKSYSKRLAERKASRLSNEGLTNNNTNNSLKHISTHQYTTQSLDDSSLRKWSSYAGISSERANGYRPSSRGADSGLAHSSYHGSIDGLDRMTAQVYPGTIGVVGPGQANTQLEQGTSIAYVAPLRQDIPSHVDGYTTPKSSSGRSQTPSSTTSTDDADKWDSLLKAKDDLIMQKDQIIDRQKKTIAQLQHQHLNMDAKLQHALLVKSCDQDSVVTLKLQEYQFEMAQLRAQLSQITNDKNMEIEKLQRKLGETEYLLDQMDACVKDTAASKDKDVDSLHTKLSVKDQTITDLQNNIDAAKKENLQLKHRIDGLERYLSEVPTTEEYQNTLKTLKEVREECSQLKDVIVNKDRKLGQMNKAYSGKSEEAKKYHKESKSLKETVATLEKNLEKYKKNGPVSEIEFEDLKMENERLEAELNRLKKLLEGKHKKMKALYSQGQTTQKALEERLVQEEDTVIALRDEITCKDNTVRQLKKSLKDMAIQNQDLMEQVLNLKTECEMYEKTRCQETEKIQLSRKLWNEFSKCVGDLKGIVQLCTARKNGQDPNMSLLLGIRGPSLSGDEFVTDDVTGLTTSLRKVQEIQHDIDQLRTFISDQYAEDVGNNCIAQ